MTDRLTHLFRNHPVRLQLALVLVLGMAAYANSFSVPLQYDDVTVLRKFIGGSLKPGFGGGPRWFTDLTFSLNRLVHGERVAGYHAVNLAIHLGAAACLYFLALSAMTALRSSFGITSGDDRGAFLQRFVPCAAAAIFVCHPLQTQAVTYIAQRYTSLAALLYLAALLAYVRARIHRTGPRAWTWASASLGMAALAMMSKEIAFTLPLMAVVLEASLFRGRLLKRPLFPVLAAALLLIIPLQLLHLSGAHGVSGVLDALRRSTVEVQEISRGDYFLTQLRVVATYLRLMILPVSQNLDYDYPVQHSLFAPQVLGALALHLSLAAAAVLLFVRSRASLLSGDPAAGIALRLAGTGIVWFYLALAVESSIIPIRDVISEHRLYLPSAGLIMAAVSLGAALADRTGRRRAAWWMAAGCCLVLTTATVARNRVWGSEMGLWTDVLAKSPNKARAHYHVGLHLAERSLPDRALPHLVRAIELNPAATDFRITLNSAVSALGRFEGRYDTGLRYHLMVYSIDPRFLVPWQAVSYNSLGLAYEYLGNDWAARANFEKAATLNPALDLAWLNLAVNAARRRDPEGFSAALGRLQAINPALAVSAAGLYKSVP